MRHLSVVLLASLAAGCASLDAGRIVVVSVVARLERARPGRPLASGSSRGAEVGLVATVTRPTGRLPPRPEPPPLPEPPRRALPCRSEALCTFEAIAVREALGRLGRSPSP